MLISSDEIWHFNGQWHKSDGSAVQISAGEDGTVVAVNEKQEVWKKHGLHGTWEKVL